MARVMVVGGGSVIGSGLSEALAAEGFQVETGGLRGSAQSVVDVVVALCDVTLPDGSGLEMIRKLTLTRPGVPLVIVSPQTTDARVIARLARGAVDDANKPLCREPSPAVVGDQCQPPAGPLAPGTGSIDRRGRVADRRTRPRIAIGELSIDVASRRLFLGSQEVGMRPKEFDLLLRLAKNAGEVVSREDLLQDVWQADWWGSSKTLNVHVNSIRRRLGEEPGQRSRITAIRNVGYRLEAS